MTMGHKDRKFAVIVALIVILSILAVDFAGSHETGNSTNILSKGHDTVYSLNPVPSLGGTTDFNSSAYTGNMMWSHKRWKFKKDEVKTLLAEKYIKPNNN